MNKIYIGAGFFALMVLIVGGAFAYQVKKGKMVQKPEQIACTMEAKLCPDGSYVGRTGPKCEFTDCPNLPEAPQESSTAKINQRILQKGLYFTPIELTEDSRCPTDVTCVWAGTVKLRTKIEDGTTSTTTMLTLETPVVIFGKSVTLTKVEPAKDSTQPTGVGDYKFTFDVSHRDSTTTSTIR